MDLAQQEDIVREHHQLNGPELEQISGDSGGQGRLACCSPWGQKGSDMTEQLKNNNNLSQRSREKHKKSQFIDINKIKLRLER